MAFLKLHARIDGSKWHVLIDAGVLVPIFCCIVRLSGASCSLRGRQYDYCLHNVMVNI